jgi:hypothetical protein
MIKQKYKIMSPNEAVQQFGTEKASQYLVRMLAELDDHRAAKYLADHYYQGNIHLGQREIVQMRHKAPFARTNT